MMVAVASCRQKMADQPRYKPLQPSSFFADGMSARPLPAGVIPHGYLNADEAFYTGKLNGQPVEDFPLPMTRELIKRGQQRFDIYCSPCHGLLGNGQGMVVIRGFQHGPPSYHIDRLREAPVGHFFDVITNGFGGMQDYSDKITPRDRWAIIGYIRALQLSQNAAVTDIPSDQLKTLGGGR